MKILNTMATTAVLAGSLLLPGGAMRAQEATIPGESISRSVTIEAIDQSSRTLTVKNDKGIYETFQAPPEIKRFSELKVGDKITARYKDNVVVRLKKPGEEAVDIGVAAAVKGGTQAPPAAGAAAQRTMTVAVTAMDPKTSSVTVSGPNGYVYSRRVADPKAFAQLKVGDKLDMTWTQALLIAVEPAK